MYIPRGARTTPVCRGADGHARLTRPRIYVLTLEARRTLVPVVSDVPYRGVP